MGPLLLPSSTNFVCGGKLAAAADIVNKEEADDDDAADAELLLEVEDVEDVAVIDGDDVDAVVVCVVDAAPAAVDSLWSYKSFWFGLLSEAASIDSTPESSY